MTIFDLLHENAIADNEVLRASDLQGDTFNIPRDVDFAFKTGERKKAEDLCDFLNGKNFGKAYVDQKEGDDLVWVFVVIHMPITQNVICSVSGFMVCVSRFFQVEYDGWGSPGQSKPSSAILGKP